MDASDSLDSDPAGDALATASVMETVPAPAAHLPASHSPTMPVVVLQSRKALPFFAGHPWVFSGAIQRVVGHPAAGDEVIVVTDRDEFVGRGLYNQHSKIQVRLYSANPDQELDEAFWTEQLDAALRLRQKVLGLNDPDGACRLVFSEGDGLSGLIVDRFAGWLIVQFTGLGMARRKDMFLRLLNERLKPEGMWLRTEKGIREAEGLEIADGPLTSSTPPRPLFITEHGLRYGVDVVEGQKTGFFVDQRDNRLAVARYAAGRRVLDLCCYSGSFAFNALQNGGAASVHAVDVSAGALELAKANAELNGFSTRITFQKSDAFKAMEELHAAGERFGMVVLDPPKLARHQRSVADGLRGYHGLNRLALQLLEDDGILATCSCSGHVTREMFEGVLSEAATSAGRRLQILEMRGAAADHPVSVHCPESEYLKCCLCRVY